MKILALQLKRIGDLVLTTPALRRLREAWPEAHLALGVMEGTSALLPAIPSVQSGIVFGRGFAPWQQVATGGWDLCFDFTGNDRSALATALSRAEKRATFEWVRRNKLCALVYNEWSPSAVRDVHTAQHYLDLVAQAAPTGQATAGDVLPELSLPLSASRSSNDAPYALLHPGTARAEKYWLPERWREVAAHLEKVHGLKSVITSGPDQFERAHVAAIDHPSSTVVRPPDLLALAGLVAAARIVVSCDTAVVHLASAFRAPQIALFGPTNPFHWRPLHERAVVLSAAHPETPLTDFQPRMKGAPMERISTAAVIRAIDSLLASPR
jgi:ADP-heptose:LPS heptosyltransferase